VTRPNHESGIDAFERFNKAQGVGTVRDPYTRWAELRRMGPVLEVDPREWTGDQQFMSGGQEAPEGFKIWSAVSYDAVHDILADSSNFSSSGYAMTMGPVLGRTILEMDPPEHTVHRKLLSQAFSRRALESWETGLVAETINGLIEGFAERGSADLVRELTFPFPVTVIAGMMGVPADRLGDFHRLAVELVSVTIDYDGALRASKSLRDLFADLLQARRAEPGDDIISVLASAEVEGEGLEDELIYSFLRLLAPAGAETTYRSSSNLLCGLLNNPDQLELLRANRDLLPYAIEEGVRWESPLTGIMRMTTAEVTVQGVEIPAGAVVHVNMAAANRDPARFEDPDRFDVTRKFKQHMGFAFGTHACLGIHLARMETRVLLNAVLDRLPGLALDPSAGEIFVSGQVFRAPSALPVVFETGREN